MNADCIRFLGTALGILVGGSGSIALAGALTDGTTGPRVQLSGEFEIGAGLGRQAGGNLFHSFERFSLATGERATFTGPDAIANVISRVTGGTRSAIDGTLASTIPGADLWFINPAGIAFGPNARLDLQGSFHVSTADELRFADGSRFSARDPSASSFTVAAPEAFGFLGADPANIGVTRESPGLSILEVDDGRDLSLVGGDVSVTGSSLAARGGQILVVSLDGPGEVSIAGEPSGEASMGTIVLSNAIVRTFGPSGGAVGLQGADIQADGVLIAVGTFGDQDSGGINVRATGDIKLVDSSLTSTTTGSGTAGTIVLEGRDIALLNGSALAADTLGPGAGGDIVVEASRAVTLSGLNFFLFSSGITSTSAKPVGPDPATMSGPAGDVSVVAPALTMTSASSIAASTSSAGSAGSITIDVDTLTLSEGARIVSQTSDEGPAGRIAIDVAETFSLGNGSVSASTSAAGAGGTIEIDANRLFVNNAFIGSNTGGSGDAGSTFINAEEVEFVNEGRVFNGTDRAGDGGPITVVADSFVADATPLDHLPRFHTGVSASANPGSMGEGGDVTVVARDIRLIDGGEISSDTDGRGPGGDVVVLAREELSISGAADLIDRVASVFASSGDAAADAAGGTVLVSAPTITISDGGTIASSSAGGGAAGDVSIGQGAVDQVKIRRGATAPDVVTIPPVAVLRLIDGAITTESAMSGGGQITLLIDELLDLRGSEIRTSVAALGGNAGDITIDPRFVVLDNSRILAGADEGRGGLIRISVDHLFRSSNSIISAEAGPAGIDGRIEISTPDADISGELVVLEGAFIDAASLLRERCAARGSEELSSFVGVGRGGLPPGPDGPLAGAYLGGQAGPALQALAGSFQTPCRGAF